MTCAIKCIDELAELRPTMRLVFFMVGTGRVVSVAYGATITVLDANRQRHKIRVQGIDAPEKAQPFGQRSKENLSRLVFNKGAGRLDQTEPLQPDCREGMGSIT